MKGDVVIVDFRPLNPAAKVRPAIVVQSDRHNGRPANTIIAQITATSHDPRRIRNSSSTRPIPIGDHRGFGCHR